MSKKQQRPNETPEGVPIPFDDSKEPVKFWKTDENDHLIPQSPGFLTDMVYYLRGTEVPTLFTLWAALISISTMVKREAWLKWFPGWDLYTNFYLIIVGGAGRVKKSTAISMATKVLEGSLNFIQGENMRRVKNLNIMRNKFTPEAMLELMDRKKKHILKNDDGTAMIDDDGEKVRYRETSELFICLPEMSVTINKREYSQTIIQNLLDLYDPHGAWDYTTKGGGKKVLTNLHTTMIAATTPEGWKDAIPTAASGDGFISRTVVAYQESTRRRFPRPRPVQAGPTMEDLQRRMAWIGENCFGEYELSSEAETYYEWWYEAHRDNIDFKGGNAGIFSRMDNHLLKIAVLMCMQRYSTERIVTKQDLMDAEKILSATVATTPELVENLSVDFDYTNKKKKIEDSLMRYPQSTRAQLLSRTHIPAVQATMILEHLLQEGRISVWSPDGTKQLDFVGKKSTEVYVYEGEYGEWYEEGAPQQPPGFKPE